MHHSEGQGDDRPDDHQDPIDPADLDSKYPKDLGGLQDPDPDDPRDLGGPDDPDRQD